MEEEPNYGDSACDFSLMSSSQWGTCFTGLVQSQTPVISPKRTRPLSEIHSCFLGCIEQMGSQHPVGLRVQSLFQAGLQLLVSSQFLQ